jgi:hypothetical protein
MDWAVIQGFGEQGEVSFSNPWYGNGVKEQ